MPQEENAQNVYDAVDYGGFINPRSHPDQLAVMAYLHGLTPAPVEQCRVLEIGCNEGRNLIPMACAIPGATFVGFDLAAQPIARGQERIERLGLKNIRLFQGDIMELDRTKPDQTLGVFDYIIAHGVYAWVPEPVRDGLLSLCRQLLTPEGVAFISYNALPGGHVRNLVREILLQYLPNGGVGVDDVTQSLDGLQFIIDSRPENDALKVLLEQEMKLLRKQGSNIIFHDELAEGFKPVSFSGFIAHAQRRGLQYISDAVIPPPMDPCFHPPTIARVKALSHGDPVVEEQTFDFLRFRMYRETLLCRDDRPAHRPVVPDLDLRSIGRLRLASLAEVAPEDLPKKSSTSAAYTAPSGLRVEIHHPGVILLVDAMMAAWPKSLSMATAERLLAANGLALDPQLLTHLFRAIVTRLVGLRTWEPPVGDGTASRPFASPTSREDAALQTRAATLIHTALDLSDPIVRQLLVLLDGTRDRAELLQALQAANPSVSPETLREGLEPTLQTFYRGCVLVGQDAGETLSSPKIF